MERRVDGLKISKIGVMIGFRWLWHRVWGARNFMENWTFLANANRFS